MACKWVVVVPADYLGFDDLRQVWKAFAVQHSIDFLPALFQAFFPHFSSNLVLRLQLR